MRYSEQIWYFLLSPPGTFQTAGPTISKPQHTKLTGSSLAEYCRYGIPSDSLTMIDDERDLVCEKGAESRVKVLLNVDVAHITLWRGYAIASS
jgi:hypothetical protein